MSRSNSVDRSRPAALSSTRQMLDELDALMERMLALPVSDLDDELQIPKISSDWRAAGDEHEDSSVAASAATATIPFYRAEVGGEALSAPHIAPRAPREVDWKLEPPPPLDEIAPPASERAPLPDLNAYPPPTFSVRRVLMAPLWLVNRIYDLCTWWLGPLGRWLRGPGRGMFGFLGVVLLLAAGAWLALDWVGWTTWLGWNW